MRICGLSLALIGLIGCTSLPMPDRLEELAYPPDATIAPTEIAEDDDPLTLAAEGLARGDHPAAATHFETYVRRHPEQVMFRLHLADILFKIHRLPEAKLHYERFIADAQESTGPPKDNIVHCHTRLMDIAQIANDPHAELFHRGVGLLILTREESEDGEMREEMLCQAIKALRESAELCPTDSRVQIYLAEAYDRAGNRRAAESARSAARSFAIPNSFTSSEWQKLLFSAPIK